MKCPNCGDRIPFYQQNEWLPDIEYIKNNMNKMYSLEELEDMSKAKLKMINWIPFKLYKELCLNCGFYKE
ncbi:hypothetical protein J3T78_02405 [Staphylococcus nepalensis]|uniref:Phage protein n=1 Tax=Staphylococcus nepalensis TaxID=214473 RepID=A0ABS3L3S9_9STAP|nr:hypothetical protein [Staphylococcus nepalensis]MBO1214097.1 hypothetical protein [Staphylococcus nepalensis]MBO1217409.1 hypothetical protein [Staphylococcus nepalensis]MBO1228219.1 hypothetical protein [Staphylococcus nepalensis]MBO1233751.1 hypothetical protein [Staphylococcus nepalensis]MBO1236559.1 hypothetical protein [Staphylococcus nepalensis]